MAYAGRGLSAFEVWCSRHGGARQRRWFGAVVALVVLSNVGMAAYLGLVHQVCVHA